MRWHVVAGLAVALVSATTAFAQPRPGGGSMVGGFRAPPGPAHHGGFTAPVGNYRMAQATPLYRPPGVGFGVSYGNGLYSGVGLRGGYGYGYGGFLSGGYYPSYVVPPPPVFVPGGGGGTVFAGEPSAATAVSGLLPATLILQYPAAAKVWLDGVEVPGDADTDWTLTSKALRPGETATFKVLGRWTAGGKTYEASREVPLGPGARSRLVVVSGTEVKE